MGSPLPILRTYIPAQTLRSQNAGLLIVPRVGRCTIGGRAFSYQAPLLWNDFSNEIRRADSLLRLKSYLYSKSFSRGARFGVGMEFLVD